MATQLASVHGAAFRVSDDDELLVSWRINAEGVYIRLIAYSKGV